MIKKVICFILINILFPCILANAQKYKAIISGGVTKEFYCGNLKHNFNNSKSSPSKGVKILILGGNPVFVVEEYSKDEYGFTNQDTVKRTFFTLSDLVFNFNGDFATWKGKAQISDNAPKVDFFMKLTKEALHVSVSNSEYFCPDVHNYDIIFFSEYYCTPK